MPTPPRPLPSGSVIARPVGIRLDRSFEDVDAHLSNRDMQIIADDIVDEFKAAAVRVGMGFNLPAEQDSFEHLMKQRLDIAAGMKQARFRELARSIHDDASRRQRELGRFSSLDLRAANSLQQARPYPASAAAAARIVRLGRADPMALHPVLRLSGSAPTDLGPQQSYANKYVSFYLDKVYCADETDWEWGSDEILLGGSAIDETGDAGIVQKWQVSNDFDRGETVDYRPDKKVVTFSVQEGGDHWPKVYHVVLMMAEEDYGGFGNWLQNLYNKIKDKVKSYLDRFLNSLGGVWGWLGSVLSYVASWVLGKIVEIIANWLNDDLIAIKKFKFTHAGPNALFAGSTQSATTVVSWQGDGGHYKTWTYWKLHN